MANAGFAQHVGKWWQQTGQEQPHPAQRGVDLWLLHLEPRRARVSMAESFHSTKQLAVHFFPYPLTQKNEQGSRFTRLSQDGPVNSPISSPRRFEESLWSLAGNSPIHFSPQERKRKPRHLEMGQWGIFHLFHQNKQHLFSFRFKWFFFSPWHLS